MIVPTSSSELVEAIKTARGPVLAVGGGTKPRLSAIEGVTRLSMTGLRGITEYEPDEYTFTALAGTPLQEIIAALKAKGQYLPFDPPFAAAGATLGGTVAAGLNGPGRFRFGGVRDFILGVRFVDGEGRLLRMGGKVVKNAAGFDLPKFFVGSLGRLGVLAEITFKVFPVRTDSLTLRLPAGDAVAISRIFTAAATARWEIDALEADPASGDVLIRLAGPTAAIATLAGEILARWPGEKLAADAAAKRWSEVLEFRWADGAESLFKLTLTPARVADFAALLREFPGARGWVGNGGNLGYLALPGAAADEALGHRLRAGAFPALTLRGAAPLFPGTHAEPAIARAVKSALDPAGRFPSLE
ncbi:MAG TPA: FAD-binding protein [Opitutaceae bacterium]|nr:FAD-binding protein [Opitutaceae bacterium]